LSHILHRQNLKNLEEKTEELSNLLLNLI